MSDIKSPNASGDLKPSLSPSISDSADSSDRNHVTGDSFVVGASAEFYEPIPEYEGRHRYDPTAQWTEKEEKRLLRKVINSTAGMFAAPSMGCC